MLMQVACLLQQDGIVVIVHGQQEIEALEIAGDHAPGPDPGDVNAPAQRCGLGAGIGRRAFVVAVRAGRINLNRDSEATLGSPLT